MTSLAALVLVPAAHAQSSCASDGQPRPVALLERFINADCAACWAGSAAFVLAAVALMHDGWRARLALSLAGAR